MTDYRKLPEILADHFAGERTWTWSADITEADSADEWRTHGPDAVECVRCGAVYAVEAGFQMSHRRPPRLLYERLRMEG